MDKLQEILSKPSFEKSVFNLDYDQKWLLFSVLFRSLGVDILKHTEARGFDPKNLEITKMLMMQASEIFEAFESFRNNDAKSNKILGFLGIEEELADVVLRIMIDSTAKEFRVAEAMIVKDKYNQTRPKMHKGKKF